MYKLFALFLTTGLFVGCSSRAATSENGGGVRQNSNLTAAPESGPSVSSGPLSQNDNHSLTIAEKRDRLMQKNRISSSASGPPPPPQFRPAESNSVVSTAMNANGDVVETRVFKDNPQLARVELTWTGPTNNRLRITLRDGRTVEAKADDIENLGSTPLSILLEKAGIKQSK